MTAPLRTSGEATRPLALVEGGALSVAASSGGARFDTPLHAGGDGARILAVSQGTAFVAAGDRVRAIDLASGRTSWTSAGGLRPFAESTVAGDAVVFVASADERSTVALRRGDGRRAFAVAGSVAGVVHGYAYGRAESRYVAYDARDGRAIWSTLGGGQGLSGSPQLVGTTLLQQSWDDGAILVGRLYAFDVRNGHALWLQQSGGAPLGFAGHSVYVDSTWFPEQLDNYVPLSVSRIDVPTGKVLAAQTYGPDPDRNGARAGENPGRSESARVAGGFVYLRVRGMWYRYDADVAPGAAHPSRLEGVDELIDAFGDGALLVAAHGEIAIARAGGERLVLQRLADAAHHSAVLRRSDGTRYLVAGGAMYAIPPNADRARKLGEARCPAPERIDAWRAGVTVICSSEGARRAIGFDDVVVAAPVPSPVAHPMVQAPSPFTSRVRLFAVPPAPGEFGHQWWLGPIAALPDGGIAFLLNRNTIAQRTAFGRASADGALRITQLSADLDRAYPEALVAGRDGVAWINDRSAAVVHAIGADGQVTETRTIGDASPPPGRGRRGQSGVRLATGPDGAVWYARSHPTREIGRIDGTAQFAVPDDVGDVMLLRGDPTGFWYVATSGLGHVSTRGAFTPVALPDGALLPRNGLAPILATASDGTAWYVHGERIVHAGPRGVLRETTLPNRTVEMKAATVGCDGALYVAEWVPQIARVAPDGHVDEFRLDVYGIDGITRGPGCKLWFLAGSNAPDQQIGTFELMKR